MSGFHLTIGIDVGISGAISVLLDGEFKATFDMPVMTKPNGKSEVNAHELAELLREQRARAPGADVFVAIELVNAFGKPSGGDDQRQRGIVSTATFMEGAGVIRGVVAALGMRYDRVTAQRWKAFHRLIGTEKDVARSKAIERFPAAAPALKRKKDIGRADALLIAQWAYLTEQTVSPRKAA